MKKLRAGLLVGMALALGASTVAPPVFADQKSQVETPAKPVETNSLSGSLLAGRVAEADNDLEAAITYYKRALSFDPMNTEIKQDLMTSLIALGRFDESVPYAEALKSNADSERFSRLILAVDAIRKKNYKDVEFLMKLALQNDIDALVSGLVTAWGKQGEGDVKAAVEKLEKLDGPDWYGLFTTYHQALIEEASGDKKQADETYKLGLENVSAAAAVPGVYLRLAEGYTGLQAREGRKADALKTLDKAEEFASGRLPLITLRQTVNGGGQVPPIAANPAQGVSEALFNVGSAVDRDGGEPLARFYLNLALALNPDNDLALMQLAEAAEQARKPAQAIAFYRKVPATSPFKRMADLQLALNLADQGEQAESVTLLNKLIEDQPDDMRAYIGLGNVYAAKENFKDAGEVYDRAAALLTQPKRDDWNVFYQRGIAYERQKMWPKAEPNFKKALELFPDQPQVLNYLGYSWIDQDMNLDEGLSLIRKAVDQRPSDGYIVDSLGWAYYKLGRYPDAVTELERAVSLKPEDPVLNDHLGDAYWRVGRQLEATFQWNHARDLKPDDPKVLAEVERKLKEGLAPAEKTPSAPAPTTPAAPAPAAPEQKSEAPAKPAEAEPAKPASADPAPTAPAAPAVTPAPAATSPARTPAAAEPAKAEPAVATPAVTPADYTVQRGQSLWSIAVERLGDGERYREIIRLNPHVRNGRITPGMQIKLPVAN